MKGDTGSGTDGERHNPYPLPGQDWGSSEDVPPPETSETSEAFQPPKIPGLEDLPPLPDVPPAKEGVSAFEAVARPARIRTSQIWLTFFAPFAIAMLVIFSWGGYRIYSVLTDDPTIPRLPTTSPTPEPEPVSTVPPKVKGWKAVTSAKYGLTYDVPRTWHILPTGTLRGYEGINGGDPVAMSSATEFREGACTDGEDEYDRGGAGFNQYVEGGTADVAKHAANKWATHAYHVDGAPDPAVTVGAPEPVRVGRAKAVHVRADVVLKAKGKCLSPTAVVHVVAVPGVAPGKTTVFVLLSDQGVPDAMPKADITKILRSVRPN